MRVQGADAHLLSDGQRVRVAGGRGWQGERRRGLANHLVGHGGGFKMELLASDCVVLSKWYKVGGVTLSAT